MKEIDVIFDRLFDFYNVGSINMLSKQLDTAPSTISNWKQRESTSAIKKKCRELGIYNDIFGDINSQINNLQKSTNNVAQNFGNQNTITSSSQSNECVQIDKMDKTVVQSFIDVYNKLEKDNNLKTLYDVLGDLKWK